MEDRSGCQLAEETTGRPASELGTLSVLHEMLKPLIPSAWDARAKSDMMTWRSQTWMVVMRAECVAGAGACAL
jgi:hypothetical protein